jgi:hypothetical protein
MLFALFKKMKLLCIFFVAFFCSPVSAQLVQSSCEGTGTLVAQYSQDAACINVLRALKYNLPYADSIALDATLQPRYISALLAVYNATTLPARDTVINILHIRKFDPEVKELYFNADSTLGWMQNLKNNVIPTGNSTIDYHMNKYALYIADYYYSGMGGNHTVIMRTTSNYNLFKLCNAMYVPGISGIYPNMWGGYNTDLLDSVNPNFIDLTYRYGWGDCESGCINWRNWKFRVYNDCSVEYKGGWNGSWQLIGIKENEEGNKKTTVYPNPSRDKLFIDAKNEIESIRIKNSLGQLFDLPIDGSVLNISSLPQGMYFLQLNSQQTIRFVKE